MNDGHNNQTSSSEMMERSLSVIIVGGYCTIPFVSTTQVVPFASFKSL